MSNVQIIDTNMDNILEYGVCGYKSLKRDGFPEKVEWLRQRFKEGLKLKTLYSDTDGTQGMIEYIPGEYCWRPVEATGYTFIHCIFTGFKRIYKNKGYGSLLFDECLKDAKKEKSHGVAVVTRKGSFMADKGLFIKHGFEVVDQAPSDSELLVKKFEKNSPAPKFKSDWEERCNQYNHGLTIIRADQCPYTVKNVKEISEVASKEYHLEPNIVNLKNHEEAQNIPCAFGTFCILYDGKIIAEHPISKGRFMNIMNKIKK
ncbi:MAG: GNAT family N-acetyltransferase [Planctomycetes bacterium]|nr:GNAT family N-acetyltransferase [Planctomycetota bacterium]